MIEGIENIDHKLLLFFNGIHFDWLDPVVFAVSSKWFWIPVILFFIYFIIKKYRKKFWIPLIAAVICFAITDQVSHLTKENYKRYRPTHNLELAQKVHVVNDYRGGQYGFFSGHATSSFGLALITLLFVKRKAYTYIIIVWAFLVSYSRIYLGVHFPSDVFVGALVGLLVALLVWKTMKSIPYFRNLIC